MRVLTRQFRNGEFVHPKLVIFSIEFDKIIRKQPLIKFILHPQELFQPCFYRANVCQQLYKEEFVPEYLSGSIKTVSNTSFETCANNDRFVEYKLLLYESGFIQVLLQLNNAINFTCHGEDCRMIIDDFE